MVNFTRVRAVETGGDTVKAYSSESITLGHSMIDTCLKASSYLPELVLCLSVFMSTPALLLLYFIYFIAQELPFPDSLTLQLLDGFGQRKDWKKVKIQEEGTG